MGLGAQAGWGIAAPTTGIGAIKGDQVDQD